MRQEVERTSVIMYYPQEEHHCPSTPGGEREKVRGWVKFDVLKGVLTHW